MLPSLTGTGRGDRREAAVSGVRRDRPRRLPRRKQKSIPALRDLPHIDAILSHQGAWPAPVASRGEERRLLQWLRKPEDREAARKSARRHYDRLPGAGLKGGERRRHPEELREAELEDEGGEGKPVERDQGASRTQRPGPRLIAWSVEAGGSKSSRRALGERPKVRTTRSAHAGRPPPPSSRRSAKARRRIVGDTELRRRRTREGLSQQLGAATLARTEKPCTPLKPR